jgi:hypothetical protein
MSSKQPAGTESGLIEQDNRKFQLRDLQHFVFNIDSDGLASIRTTTVDASGGDTILGGVEIKDGETDARAKVGDPSAISPSDNALAVSDVNNVGPLLEPTHWSPNDGTVAFTTNTTITCSGFPFTVDDANCTVVAIYYKPTGGTWQQTLINGSRGVSMVALNNVITVAGAGTPFATGDTYLVAIKNQQKTITTNTQSQRTGEIDPLPQQYITETTVLTNVANATPEYVYINMDGFRGVTVQVEKTGGTDTFDTDFESSVEGADASDKWEDTTANWTFVAGSATADHIAVPSDPKFIPRGHRVEISTGGTADDADFNIFVKKFF